MSYKLLMESWRKFLKEEEETAGSPYDPMAGDPDMERLRSKMQKYKDDNKDAEEFLSKLRSRDGDETFPIVDGKNFLLPIEGFTKVRGDFYQSRPGGLHLGIDQFPNPAKGTELVAVSDGVITNNNATSYARSVKGLVNVINREIESGEFVQSVTKAMGYTINNLKRQAASSRDPKKKAPAADPKDAAQ